MVETEIQVVFNTYGEQIEMELPIRRGFNFKRVVTVTAEDIERNIRGEILIKDSEDVSEASNEAKQTSHYALTYKINSLIQEAENSGEEFGDLELLVDL